MDALEDSAAQSFAYDANNEQHISVEICSCTLHCGGNATVLPAAAYVDPDCAVITPTDAAPVSSRAGGVTMNVKRVMPYCVILLDSNVACMMGAESGGHPATTPPTPRSCRWTCSTPPLCASQPVRSLLHGSGVAAIACMPDPLLLPAMVSASPVMCAAAATAHVVPMCLLFFSDYFMII